MKKTRIFGGAAALILALAAGPALAGSGVEKGFEALKGLAGRWEGTNSKGEPVQLRYELAADGTAVVEHLDVQGEETHHNMVTLFHMDGDRLVLTHYCAAGNQPRMVARKAGEKELRFEFLDATGIASEEEGHMHRAVFRFDGADLLISAWTWREGGEDRFTETIRVERAASTARR